MPYKDPEKQRAASYKYWLANKEDYAERQRNRRRGLGMVERPVRPRKPPCPVCGEKVGRSNRIHCSRLCQRNAEFTAKLDRWQAGEEPWTGPETIKVVLAKIYGRKCDECGLEEWRGVPIPLQVNHKDGNSTDNRLVNVHLLCPNCHALTPTFGFRNKGNGRAARQRRRLKEKAAGIAQG
jgi:hypothetical protein